MPQRCADALFMERCAKTRCLGNIIINVHGMMLTDLVYEMKISNVGKDTGIEVGPISTLSRVPKLPCQRVGLGTEVLNTTNTGIPISSVLCHYINQAANSPGSQVLILCSLKSIPFNFSGLGEPWPPEYATGFVIPRVVLHAVACYALWRVIGDQ